MMLWAAIAITVFGLAHCQEGETAFPDETEWDCTDDHAPSNNPNKFLQSPAGFGEGAPVFEATCPTPLQVFSQVDGLCRCLYTQELRDLLAQPCQVRLVPGDSRVYDILVPNKLKSTIEELYERRTCDAVLPPNIVQFFNNLNVQPLFFNMVNCSCDWTEEALRVSSRPVGEGQRCERLVDLNFTTVAVSSDEVGNWADVFPFQRQNNMTLSEGGAVFGNEHIAVVMWRLAALDFVDMNLVAHFRASTGNANQLIFTNMCRDRQQTAGFVELMYNPSNRRYSLRFFGDRVAECSPQNAPGGFADQVANVIFRDGIVRLEVNGFDCDVSSLNPVPFRNANGGDRLAFSPQCPFQLGGAVFTDIAQADFGRADDRIGPFSGIYKRFLVTRDCRNPPQMVLDRMRGSA